MSSFSNPAFAFLVLGITALAGCASTHNLKADGINILGGGFIEEELQPGFFRMSATSNTALWASTDGAAETWKKRADHLCGKDAYVNIDTFNSQDSRLSPVSLRHGVVVWGSASNATISGYVLCNSSRMTVGDATDFLKNRQAVAERQVSESLKTELDELGGDNCAEAQPGVLPETYFRRGKKLLALQRYSDARSCFILTQELEKGTHFSKESCISLGFMYEIGLGVEKDIQKAQEWYRKAGL